MKLSSLQKLASLSLSTEQMAGVTEVLAVELEPLETSRELAATRQARFKQRHGNVRLPLLSERDGNVMVTADEAAKESSPTPPKENNTLSEKEGFEESKKVVNARARKSYPELFDKFWLAFPTDPGMSKAEAFKAWGRLRYEDHQPAIDAIPAFKEWVRKQGESYRIVHACRYLSQRRFDGFKAQDEKAKVFVQSMVYVKFGTKAWDAWEKLYRATKGTTPPHDFNGGWYFPSEFPSEGATQ